MLASSCLLLSAVAVSAAGFTPQQFASCRALGFNELQCQYKSCRQDGRSEARCATGGQQPFTPSQWGSCRALGFSERQCQYKSCKQQGLSDAQCLASGPDRLRATLAALALPAAAAEFD